MNDQVEYVVCEAHPDQPFPHCGAPGIVIREPGPDTAAEPSEDA